MRIGFCGQLYGKKMEDAIGSHNKVSYAIRKFNGNFVAALACFSEINVYSPIHEKSIYDNIEVEGRKTYKYLRYYGKLGRVNLLIKSFLSAFLGNETVYFVDALNVSQALGVIVASRLKKKRVISIITDIPQAILDGKPGLFGKAFLCIIRKSNALVVLTNQTAIDFNTLHKPFVIIEGIANDIHELNMLPLDEHICIYAGGLSDKYYISQMAECFEKVAKHDEYLYIFGDGESKEKIVEIANKGSHVKYMGVMDNKMVMEYELKSILLINPRPNNGEYTKYSFPSKLIEYMSTGVAVLGNKLDGVPNEYYEHMYLFDGYTKDSYCASIRKLLDTNVNDLSAKGRRAKNFIIERNGIRATSEKLRYLLNEIEDK